MSFDLYLKECKAILKNFVYIIFVGVLILFYIFDHANFGSYDIDAYYYSKSDDIYSSLKTVIEEENIIKGSKRFAERLKTEFEKNEYIIFPEGFHITASLNEEDQIKMKQLIYNIENTTTAQQLDEYSYQLGKILSVDNYSINEDTITGAYARYFVSVMGFPIAMYSIFAVVAYVIRDKKKNINELAYTKKMNSSKIIFSRYFALVTMIIMPVVLLALIPTIQFIILAIRTGIPVDSFAFIKYIIGWILPTALFVPSFGFFVTMLRNSPVAIFLQCVYSLFWMIMSATYNGIKTYGFEISLESNPFDHVYKIYNLNEIRNNMMQIIINRSFYTALAILLLIATIRLFDLKRKGLK